MATASNKYYYFSPSAITITPSLNDNGSFVGVSVVSNSRIYVDNTTYSFLDSKSWLLSGNNVVLNSDFGSAAVYIYIALRLGFNTATVVFGNEEFTDTVTLQSGDNPAYAFVKVGKLSAATDDVRTLESFDTGAYSYHGGGTATTSIYAETAKYAETAAYAETAGAAQSALEATHATSADTASEATHASSAADLDESKQQELDNKYLRKDQDDTTTHKLKTKELETTDNLTVGGSANIECSLDVGGDSTVHGNATVSGDSVTGGNSTTKGNLSAHGNATLGSNNTNTHTINGATTFNNSVSIKEDLSVAARSKLHLTTFGEYSKNPQGVGALVGAEITANGRINAVSLELSESLTVPELRFNRATVTIGVGIRSVGGGIIDEVQPDVTADGTQLLSGWAHLRLEEGEYGAIDTDDLNMGFWHFEGDGKSHNADEDADGKNGDYQMKGFASVYFRIDEIPEAYHGTANSDNSWFHYVLRGTDPVTGVEYSAHPHQGMHFGCIGNISTEKNAAGEYVKEYRQKITYETTTYTVRTLDRRNWTYTTDNIVHISGELDGFSMRAKVYDRASGTYKYYTKEFHGNGDVFGNAYFYGTMETFQRQIYRLTVETEDGDLFMLPGETKVVYGTLTDGDGNDHTSEVQRWKITRNSSNTLEDTLWNQQHSNFNGTIELTIDDLGINQYSTIFTLTAFFGNEESATAELIA